MSVNNAVNLPKFFVTKSGFGFEEGVYSLEELKSLPKSAHQYVISLAVAESMGYVKLDHQAGKSINELDVFAGPEIETGRVKQLRGVSVGTVGSQSSIISKTTEKLGNALQAKIQDMKQKSTEDSLKAKIEAKKKELGTTK